MGERLCWAADPELADLLRRYYQGEAALWPVIQSRVHDELHRRGLPVAPRHMRFRRTGEGYEVILEGAEGYLI